MEGFTNPLWTLYFALLHLAGLEGSYAALAVSATGIVLVVMTGWLVAVLVDRGVRDHPDLRWMAWLAGGSVPLCFPFAFWALGGMEVGLLGLLWVLMAVAALRVFDAWEEDGQGRASLLAVGVTGAAGVLTRIDFAVVAGVAASLLLFWAPVRRRRLVAVFVIAPLAMAVIGVLAWQQCYYGDWLTNTYHLKVEGYEILDRLPRGFRAAGKVLSVGPGFGVIGLV